jgi:hypothetical protein
MISKRNLTARNPNPYNLTPAQLADLEITKAQVAKHLASIDFSKHNQLASNQEVELQAERVRKFISILKEGSR